MTSQGSICDIGKFYPTMVIVILRLAHSAHFTLALGSPTEPDFAAKRLHLFIYLFIYFYKFFFLTFIYF